MRGRRAPAIQVTDRQRDTLEALVRGSTTEQRLVDRARVVLLATAGQTNKVIASELRVDRRMPGRWRRRWWEAWPHLCTVEREEGSPALGRHIEALLTDRPRPGRPSTFAPEQIIDIIAMACEDPEASDQPIDPWTAEALAQEAMKRGIVERISRRTVGRFLKGGRPEAASGAVVAAPLA